MADVIRFMRQGWKNIWKQELIWLFSALPVVIYLYIVQIPRGINLLWSFIGLAASLISLLLICASYIGVPYLAWCFSIGKSVTIQEVLVAIRKFSGRVLGCSCLGLLLLSPLFLWTLVTSLDVSTKTLEISNATILAGLSISIFSAIWEFSFFGFFANDWGIRHSIENAWAIFTSHFRVLATLGVTLAVIFKICTATSGALTILIQSGFDVTSLAAINYINPSAALSRNILFMMINGVGQIIFTPFSASVFALAYLKYSGMKIPRSLSDSRPSGN